MNPQLFTFSTPNSYEPQLLICETPNSYSLYIPILYEIQDRQTPNYLLLREHFRDSGESLCGVVEKNKKRVEREKKIKSESTLTISSYQNGFSVN